MKSNIIALTQKDLHLLGLNLGAIRLGYNCYLYESNLHSHENLCMSLGYHPSMIKWTNCYQVAYSFNSYGNIGQLHRVELETVTGCHITKFVYYTCIKYKD